MAKDVLHHDDGGIDNDAEVNRADRQQIGRLSAQDRDDEEQRRRDRFDVTVISRYFPEFEREMPRWQLK
jgi:hypothetical protein